MFLTDDFEINENELKWDFVRSSGPGGQNVNKVATAVQLRFNINASKSIPDEIKQRLKKLAGKRLTQDGELVITARRHRSQLQNRADAFSRLILIIQKAAEKPSVRKHTRPSLSARRNRLEAKRRQSEKKKMRTMVIKDD